MNKEQKQPNIEAQFALQNVRQRALEWWGNLTNQEKFEARNKVEILDGRTWQNLTGREIQMIFEAHVA